MLEKFNSGEIFLLKDHDVPVAIVTLVTKAPLYYTRNADGPNGGCIDYKIMFLNP